MESKSPLGSLPLGKLPPDLLAKLLASVPLSDPRVLLGPGVGRDCAVLDFGEKVLVLKSDPITFATDDIGWYAVQINANDIATTGSTPRWMLATLLLPENDTSADLVEHIFKQINQAAGALGISLIGGHTEITHGINRPILMGTLLGEVERNKLIIPSGAQPGDQLLLTKGVPIEATALLAREFSHVLKQVLSGAEIEEARQFLYQPGISVVRDAQVATHAGKVTAMHDPTEGGLAAALWELAEASGNHLTFIPEAVHIPALSKKICDFFGLDPLVTIASGALLLSARPESADTICDALKNEGISCSRIGEVEAGAVGVSTPGGAVLARPERDDITRVYENGGVNRTS